MTVVPFSLTPSPQLGTPMLAVEYQGELSAPTVQEPLPVLTAEGAPAQPITIHVHVPPQPAPVVDLAPLLGELRILNDQLQVLRNELYNRSAAGRWRRFRAWLRAFFS